MESDGTRLRRPLDTVVGLGANLGSPEVTLVRAVGDLRTLGEVSAVSSLYCTAPVGGPLQPDFLNAAVRLGFGGSAEDLLRCLRDIECAAGRVRRERWGPRILDLDILWIKDLRLSVPQLEVPHPRLRERAFALRPLVDVAPEARDPEDGDSYAAILAHLGTAGVRDLGRSWVGLDSSGFAAGMDRPRP